MTADYFQETNRRVASPLGAGPQFERGARLFCGGRSGTRSATMRVFWHMLVFVLLVTLVGCSDYEGVTLVHQQTVEISPGLPASSTNAVLHLRLVPTLDASSTNKREMIAGSRSLNSPVGSGGDSSGHYHEQRLVAIRVDGFLILFTKRDGGATQTNSLVFPYGQTTQTNALGWRIVGYFK